MEQKKLKLATKKLQGAISTFSAAAKEAEEANELLIQSKNEDLATIEKYEKQIESVYQAIDHVQSVVISKEAAIKENEALISRLKEFTV